MSTNTSSIGELIKQERIKKGLTQGELASAIGVTMAAVSRYELNQRVPRAEVLTKIATALEISVANLIGVPSEKKKQLEWADNVMIKIEAQLRDERDPQKKEMYNQMIEWIEENKSSAVSLAIIADQAQINAMRVTVRENENIENTATRRAEKKRQKRENELLSVFGELSDDGQQKAIDIIKDIRMAEEYKRSQSSKKGVSADEE